VMSDTYIKRMHNYVLQLQSRCDWVCPLTVMKGAAVSTLPSVGLCVIQLSNTPNYIISWYRKTRKYRCGGFLCKTNTCTYIYIYVSLFNQNQCRTILEKKYSILDYETFHTCVNLFFYNSV